ncbi:MAG: hypothetical protein NW224_09875 [Leptolyngbyaceae cyanobacterium bins.302]|nr:hypothetical protein [Leptolyngbyaceae cyanobacterium bins.302]
MKITQALFVPCGLAVAALFYAGIAPVANAYSLAQTTAQTNLKSLPSNPVIQGQLLGQARPRAAVLALDSDGLRLVNASTGSTRALSFGMKQAEVVSILTNLRGKPQEQGTNQECGAGPLGYANWNDGLSLKFNKGVFAGWSVDGRNKGANKLTTISGIGTGSTRSQLQKVYAVKIQQTSLGTEFSNNGLGGILSGNKPSDRITTLWSGTTCLFR